MSILIKGMDMPKGNSTKNVLIYSDGRVFTGHKNDENYSAEEQKNGEWIEPSAEGVWHFDHKTYAECSVCGKKEFLGWKKRFCPNCGADMRGEENERSDQ